jgi:nucleotide-binding universal stress UspA family protein
MKMNILSCIYGGEYGFTALRIACQIAKAMNSDLTVLYAVEEVPSRFTSRFEHTIVGPGQTLADLIRDLPHLKDKIFRKIDEITEEYGVKAEKKMASGKKIADVILKESDDYDLVVLGSAGFKGVERVLFGSVSYEVAEFARVPVLVVKRKTDKIKKILSCTDGSEAARRACLFAGTLGKALGAEVSILSVAPEFFDEEIARQCDLECALEVKKKIGIEVNQICRGGKGVKSVREEILKEAPKYDLVVCGSRGLSRMERVKMGHVSLAVKENADTNVLIVREYKE